MDKVNLQQLPSFVTVDGSSIRELAGPTPDSAPSAHQSLAEATLAPGGETAEHYHPRAEEVYYFTGGAGRMRLGEEETPIVAGDCVVIPPGIPHKISNEDGATMPLTLLCCCSPPYSDDDTVMTGR